MRCMHEKQSHERSAFITLTYDEEHLPQDGGLDVSHFQKFMKRLRKKRGKVRFFHCGEYGDMKGRPHYHAILFGIDFWDDQVLVEEKNDNPYYISAELAQLWPFGQHRIGEVTFESSAYVARYIMKKITGKQAPEHYA